MPLISAPSQLFALSVPHSIGLSMNRVALISLLSHHAPEGSVATTIGVSVSVGNLSKLMGQMAGGWIYEFGGLVATPLVASALSVIACVVVNSVPLHASMYEDTRAYKQLK